MARQAATISCQTLPSAAWQRHGLCALLCLMLLLFANGAAAHASPPAEAHHAAAGHAHHTASAIALAGDDSHRGPFCHAGHAPLAPHTLLRAERQEIEHGMALCSLAQLSPPPAVLVVSGTPHGRPDSNAPPIYLLTQRLRP